MFAKEPNGGIVLHVDAGAMLSQNMESGSLQGGDEIKMPNGDHIDIVYFGRPNDLNIPGQVSRSFDDIKQNYFGTTDKWAREFVFHYAVIVDQLGTPPGEILPNTGLAEQLGNDLIVSLQGDTNAFLQANTLAHELGHNLGLEHGGIDNQSSPPPIYNNYDNGLHNAQEYKPNYGMCQ